MGKFKELDIEIQDCVEDLKKLRGLAPHNHPSNLVYGDSYFARSIDSKYTAQVREEAEKRLETECEKLTVRITPEQQEILSHLIIKERNAIRVAAPDQDNLAKLKAASEMYDKLSLVLEEVTGHPSD